MTANLKCTAAVEPLPHEIAGAISALAGPGVGVSVIRILEAQQLFADEFAFILNASPARRKEFAAGRSSARLALAALDGPASPILRGEFYEPVWPSGFAGSITHDGAFAAALACRSTSGLCPYGLDIVDLHGRHASGFQEIAGAILTSKERAWVSAEKISIAEIFSFKEAAIKIISPKSRRFVDFKSIELNRIPASGGLLLKSGNDTMICGRTIILGTLLISVARLLDE